MKYVKWSNIKFDYLKKVLIKKAMQSDCRYKIAAVAINKREEIISYACNQHRFMKHGGGIHAEQILISRHPSVRTIIICRINKKGKLIPIHPCKKCLKIAHKKRIKIISLNPKAYDIKNL